jgi:lipopolysaccharide transport system permease protein
VSDALIEVALPERRPTIRIRPARTFLDVDVKELWRYHELLFFLVWKNVKVRYKQTVMGFGWAIVQPFVSMVIFTVIFGHLAHLKADYGIPYALFVFSGMLPWTFFAVAVGGSSSSIVSNSTLVTKVYFPRIILPLSTVAIPLIDFAIGFVIFWGLFFYYHQVPTWHVVFFPLFLAVGFLAAAGISLFFAAMNVRYRDAGYLLPFLVQFWMYFTPVIYPVSLIPARFRPFLAINPMAGVLDGFRWSVVGRGSPHVTLYLISFATATALFMAGLAYFHRFEQGFADTI